MWDGDDVSEYIEFGGPCGLVPIQALEVNRADPVRRLQIACLMQALVDFEAGVRHLTGKSKSFNAIRCARDIDELKTWFFEDVEFPGPFAFQIITDALELSVDRCRQRLQRWLDGKLNGNKVTLGARRLRGETHGPRKITEGRWEGPPRRGV